MISLRARLLVLLLTATGVLWLCAALWITFGSRAELEHVLDTRLQEAARMVHSLVASGNMDAKATALPFDESRYERQLSCQIWSLDGRLVARSSGAPEENLAAEEGFADRTVQGETWRVYTIIDASKGVRVAVGDRIGLRNRLVRDLVAGLLAPAALIVPLFGLSIWLAVGRAVAPLTAIADDIANRNGDDMRPVASESAPAEVRPLLLAINSQFAKVEAARRHEKDVTAFAAHELRTPLAGLKTQAQVALATQDAAMRDNALRQIILSVDRASRLVRQLLALARLEARAEGSPAEPVNAGSVLREVIAETKTRDDIHVGIDPALDTLVIAGDRESLHLALRNLHENAVEHMGAGGLITWKAAVEGGLCVEDEGPGIPEQELDVVKKRFHRGTLKTATGTGLGLTIADMAAARMGLTLTLANRQDRSGLRAVLSPVAKG